MRNMVEVKEAAEVEAMEEKSFRMRKKIITIFPMKKRNTKKMTIIHQSHQAKNQTIMKIIQIKHMKRKTHIPLQKNLFMKIKNLFMF